MKVIESSPGRGSLMNAGDAQDKSSNRWFPTLEAASQIYDVPLATLRWWVQTGKLRPETGLCYIGKSAHLDVRIFEAALLMRRGPRRKLTVNPSPATC